MAERVGFEPTIRLPVCRISSAVLSTTQPPLRGSGRRLCSAGCLIAAIEGAGKSEKSIILCCVVDRPDGSQSGSAVSCCRKDNG